MKDRECMEFLQWCLPRLNMRWTGFRKVRKQVCKRVGRRMGELGILHYPAYREYLATFPEEWTLLDSMCRITISRFYRDKGVFREIEASVLPEAARLAGYDKSSGVSCWSAGCMAGEEAFTLRILWNDRVLPILENKLSLHIIATDADPEMLGRAKAGRYERSAIKEMPEELIRTAFDIEERHCVLREQYKKNVQLIEQDIRMEMPSERFHVVCCRNLVFTYYIESEQEAILENIADRIIPGGFLIVGIHETLPKGNAARVFEKYSPGIYRKLIS